MRCENVANRCECAAYKLRMRGKQIATMWRTFGECVANGLQQRGGRMRMRGKRIATMQHSKNKNHTFVTQKPPFCTSKTILLHRKNHTFVMRICNIQKTNTLRTFRECILNGLRMRGEHPEIGCKTLRNIPTYTHEIGCEQIAKHCWRSAKTLRNTLHHSALRTTMPQHTNIKKRIKFTTEYEKNNTNSKHFHHHFPTLICAKTPFTIEQPILVRHIHTVWRGVHRPNFNHNKRI